MKQDFNETARSGKTESLNEVLIRLGYLQPENEPTQDEVLVAILTRIQRMRMPVRNDNILMSEHWDWIVVLQCMQDNGLFTVHPQRMPLTEFEIWVREHHVPQMITKCTKRTMSYALTAIHSARYPWTDVVWKTNVLERWRILYRTLNSMLQDATNVPK